MNNNSKKRVFMSTRSKNDLQQKLTDVEACIQATHWSRYEDAIDLIDLNTELYKGYEDKSSLVYALMRLGEDLFDNSKMKQGSIACFKAYQLDPEHRNVKKFREYCDHPKSTEEIEIVVKALRRAQRKK